MDIEDSLVIFMFCANYSFKAANTNFKVVKCKNVPKNVTPLCLDVYVSGIPTFMKKLRRLATALYLL